ncbi:MAG: hypothetical protein PVG74_20235, partial [Desulfobacterales bacterium]
DEGRLTKDELWMSLRSFFLIYKIDRIPYSILDVQGPTISVSFSIKLPALRTAIGAVMTINSS